VDTSSHPERRDAVRARLDVALDPQTDIEQAVLEHLGRWSELPAVEALADMAERRVTPRTAGRHNWADLLRLVDDVRRLADDRSLALDDALRRLRDLLGVYDGRIGED
jgi:hypothetical protein